MELWAATRVPDTTSKARMRIAPPFGVVSVVPRGRPSKTDDFWVPENKFSYDAGVFEMKAAGPCRFTGLTPSVLLWFEIFAARACFLSLFENTDFRFLDRFLDRLYPLF